jgi:hypothetical protein
MVRQQYPLEALRKLRDERAEAQAQALAMQVARCAAAEALVMKREQLRREHALTTAAMLRAERERLGAGLASAADVQRAGDFEVTARDQARALERSEAEARELLAQQRAEERRLREELGRREAEAKLSRNHEANFHEQRASATLRAEEEASLERWNARRR